MSRFSAYVDGSVPHAGATYLLSCALVAETDADDVRARLVRVRRQGEHKVHWRDRLPKERSELVAVVATLRATHLIVVRESNVVEPTERRRRKCLERLLWSLDQRGDVERILMEARQAKQNGRDRKILDVMRASRTVGRRLRMDHVAGPEEPLLWIPDIVAGAYSNSLSGINLAFEALADGVEIISVID